jgi:hypothetical protein
VQKTLVDDVSGTGADAPYAVSREARL